MLFPPCCEVQRWGFGVLECARSDREVIEECARVWFGAGASRLPGGRSARVFRSVRVGGVSWLSGARSTHWFPICAFHWSAIAVESEECVRNRSLHRILKVSIELLCRVCLRVQLSASLVPAALVIVAAGFRV